MAEVLSPTDWGARVNYDTWTDPYTPDEGVVIHHGGGGDYPAAQHPFSRDKEMSQLRSWEAFHIDGRGWRGLAYGWGIGQTGTIYRIRGWNRYGAHLGDIDGDGIANNEELIPVIWILSGLIHRSSQAMQDSTEWLRREVIEPKAPLALQLYGHREVQDKPTTCPGPLSMVYIESHRFLGSPSPPIEPPPTEPPSTWTKDLIMALPTLAKGDGFASEGKASTRPDVANAQGLLLANGHKDENSATPETATDGWFGSGTDKSTRDFQTEKRLTVDGVIGQNTWTTLLGQ